MARGSIVRPLAIYALFFTIATALFVATVAGRMLFATQENASIRALEQAAQEIAQRIDRAEFADLAQTGARLGGEMAVVDAATSAFGVDVAHARKLALSPNADPSLGAVLVQGDGRETYVVFRTTTEGILRSLGPRLRRLAWIAAGGAVVFALALTVFLRRLVLSPLKNLRLVAVDSRASDPLEWLEGDAPNEMVDVARAFRRTQRRLEQERAELARQHESLTKMHAQLVSASKLAGVGRLAAGVAHEIGNPLAAVLGYLALLQQGLDPDETKDVLSRSQRELQRIHETIKKLLAYARSDESPEPIGAFSTTSVIRDALSLVKGHPAMKGALVVNHAEVDMGDDARGRPRALEQVLVNLLINAGQAVTGVSAGRVEIWRDVTDDGVCIWVEDNGPGIVREHRAQIFDPFFTTKPLGEGTGLGLAVSRSLVEAMGGQLSVGEKTTPGAVFQVKLEPTSAQNHPKPDATNGFGER